jgi:23S rRNA (uracil1939-C5)-methyltransferase
LNRNASRPHGRRAPRIERPAHPLEGNVLDLSVESLALGGAGVARLGEDAGESAGLTVFVEGALPGSRVRARIVKMHKRHAEARAVETLAPSPEAVEPFCPHFGVCGGCVLQNLDPAAQLEWKARQIADALSRIGRVTPEEFLPPAPAPALREFRNKMEFAFQGIGAGLRLGLYSRADPGRVFDLSACPIFPAAGMDILSRVRAACREAGLSAYDRRTGQGLLRHLLLRHSVRENRFLAQILTAPVPADSAPARTLREMGEGLLRALPELAGFVHAERARADGLAQAERTVLALGESALVEELGGVRYSVSADAFFQTSTGGALALYCAAAELADLSPADVVYDLYSGGGGIALFLAGRCARVLGLEVNAAAVADAEANARVNGLANCRFLRADLDGETPLPARLPEGFAKADAVIADPPREGLSAGIVGWLLANRPARLVYVSCNPATLARDAGLLREGFDLSAVRAVDLFPHTAHAECVALFRAR